MTLGDIPSGTSVFIDANLFVYYYGPSSKFGAATKDFFERLDKQDVTGVTSTHVLAEAVHKVIGLEACAAFGWSNVGLARQLKQHPTDVKKLFRYRRVMDELALFKIQILLVQGTDLSKALDLPTQYGLLANDAVTVAVMRANGLSQLASNDADFDRVPGLTRYSPA